MQSISFSILLIYPTETLRYSCHADAADACHVHRDQEVPSYAEEASKHPLTEFAKATYLFVADSSQALLWISFHYLIKILIS